MLNVNRLVFRFLLLWLFFSAIYYIQAIYVGVAILKEGENIYHKILKYSICILLSLGIIFLSKKISIFLVAVLFFTLSAFSFLESGKVTVFSTTMLIIATMISFIYIIPTFYLHIEKINYVLLWTGVVVGTVSILELTVFYSQMAPYWVSTGGVRSVSSLLNPTNSGGYSAIMILIALATKVRNPAIKLLFIVMPMITLIFSGSRTAWLTLSLVMLLTPFLQDHASRRLRKYIPLMVIFGILSVVIYISISTDAFSGIEAQHRGLDTHTASIRLENLFSYINQLDLDILFPDVNDNKIGLITDSFYLVLLNYFGLFIFSFLVFIAILMFFINMKHHKIQKNIPADIAIWKVIFVYFAVAGLSSSFINSFPLNQLFFISCGYYIYKARFYKVSNA